MNYFDQHRDAFLQGLESFLRIPSISTLPEHKADVDAAARWVAAELESAGLENVRVIEGEGHPLVYGDWLHAPGKPTLLCYGHYDVQPVEPLEEWITPPFEPHIRDGNIYARGAADDKGQTYILIKAVEGLLRTHSRLPVNVRFLIEGEEEVSGEHIAGYVASHAQSLQADAAVICDTEMFAPDLPTLCVGLRGIVYTELHVQGARQDLHSGVYGGAAPNAVEAVAQIVAALKDREGRVRIPGFYDRVRPPSDQERDAWNRLPFHEDTYRETEVGSTALTGEPGIPVLERTWARPTFEVHGIRGGFVGEGGKTVIPAKAVAKISMRLVPDQQPEEVAEQFRAAVAESCPPGVTAEVKVLSGAPPSVVDPGSPFIRASAEAMRQVFGKETVYIRSGGSIPIVGLFQEHLDIPSVMMGFGLPDDNIHAPNEKLNLDNFFRGMVAVARYLELLGGESQ
jgi:acetylornithine deacetylase/succinyl-diaminopimelate desuccinylase-like protein